MKGPKRSQNEYIVHDDLEQYKLQIIDHYMLEIQNFDNAARYCTYNDSPTFSNYNPPVKLQPSHRYVITPYFKSSLTTSSSPSSHRRRTHNWSFDENDLRRKTRITTYRTYTMETKFKASVKNGFRWVKRRCHRIVHDH